MVAVSVFVAVVFAGCAGGAIASPTQAGPQALPAGDYRSNAFSPSVSFTLPDGWIITEDSPTFLSMQPVNADAVGIHVFRSPGAASQQPDCPTTAISGVGPLAKDLVDWIQSLPGLQVRAPTSVVLGGLVGFETELRIVDGWKASCPFANGLPTVPLLVGTTDGLRWVMADTERLRLSILDVPGSGTVVVDVDAFDGALFDSFLPFATPIVASMKFAR